MLTSYDMLLNILDRIIEEAPEKYSKLYEKDRSKTEQYNSSLSRAFIHMFLKVRFDILSFEEREHYVTDGPNDGGVDGYYIDKNNKLIYLIQSKFRISENNFREKEISMRELLSMDIKRITSGESVDENGNEYRGKIKQFQRELSEIDDLPRYSFKVIVFANLKGVSETDLTRLTGGFKVEVIDNEKCYSDFVFPIISGTYYSKSDLVIQIDLSNKLANKISYTVETAIGECDITVLFVPTLEIGKFMSKYKNSILKYNPRSYLGFKFQAVNKNIAESITEKKTNEFSLFNNGITLLSEETSISEQVAQKGVAKLIVKNPQIINGGQTSFTLSRLYEDNDDKTIFDKKEVLLKIITLPEVANNKEDLIEKISNATNHQTPVSPSDRFSNQPEQIELQKVIFNNFGMLYERKKGEFSDGITKGYINEKDIIDRSLFIKIYYTIHCKISSSKFRKLFINHNWSYEEIHNYEMIKKTLFGCRGYSILTRKIGMNSNGIDVLAKVKTLLLLFYTDNLNTFDDIIEEGINIIEKHWEEFIEKVSYKFIKTTIVHDPVSNEDKIIYKRPRKKQINWINSDEFENDVLDYWKLVVPDK